jgi:cadmium resistance protein CadD (predicted permease)
MVLDFPALVGVGIAAFVSTNIDDLFILIVFFATPRFPSSQIKQFSKIWPYYLRISK